MTEEGTILISVLTPKQETLANISSTSAANEQLLPHRPPHQYKDLLIARSLNRMGNKKIKFVLEIF